MNYTNFGFKQIDETEKQSRVREVFDAVADRYDLMNDIMSLSLHRLWKREMVADLDLQAGMKILDVAGGTGDIAFRIAEKFRNIENNFDEKHYNKKPAEIIICDINEAMLHEGRNRAIDKNLLQFTAENNQNTSAVKLTLVCANAESLPFPDNYFDAYTIAFGIRNVTHIERALSEAYRVLKIGGRFLCLEFSPLENSLLGKIYDAYSFKVIPFLGEKITGNRDSYQYLVESIRLFPNKKKFAEMIKKSGFGNVNFRKLSGGVVAIHSGRKL